MKRIGWYLILLICLLGYQVHAVAQHISVSAPSHVAAGENFRVAYTINTRDVEEFRMGAVQDGLEVIAGPYTSSQSSYQMINGHTSSSSSVTITYTLYAAKNGTFNIGASHAVVGGRSLASHAVRITVSGHAQHTNGAPSMHRIATTNLVCVPQALPSQAATSSSRCLPTRREYTSRNLSCLPTRYIHRWNSPSWKARCQT